MTSGSFHKRAGSGMLCEILLISSPLSNHQFTSHYGYEDVCFFPIVTAALRLHFV
jgi:hypothetical protein